MLKKWFAEILALAISASSLTPLHGGETTHLPNSGKQIVHEVEISYQKGEYATFLKQMHEQYQNAGKAGALRGVFESAKAAMHTNPEKVAENLEKYRSKIKELDKELNQRLLDAINESPNLEIVQKIDAIVFNAPSEEHNEILTELDSLKFKVPEDAQGTVENKISALETEYYIKSLLLDVASHHSKNVTDDFHKKKIALGLEKLDKMDETAKEFDDIFWMKKIQKAKEANRALKAFRMDFEVLQGLGLGNIHPENTVEEKVKEIMMEYLQQKRSVSEIAQQS